MASNAALAANGPGALTPVVETTGAAGLSALRRLLSIVVGVSWAINVGLLLTAAGWIYFFGESRETIALMKRAVWSGDATSGSAILDPSRLGIGVAVGLVCIAVALVACLAMLASLFVGCGRFRTTRMWLVFTAVVCGWLGLVVSWQSVYWFGQQQRMKAVLPAAEGLVGTLRSRWPTVDSDLPELGPFLAYPLSGPTALLPLRSATFPTTETRYSAVERTGDVAMRFELSGGEHGAWLEWRGDGSEPTAFAGGLDTSYVVAKAARLSADWFLVRYQAAGLVDRGVFTSPQTR